MTSILEKKVDRERLRVAGAVICYCIVAKDFCMLLGSQFDPMLAPLLGWLHGSVCPLGLTLPAVRLCHLSILSSKYG